MTSKKAKDLVVYVYSNFHLLKNSSKYEKRKLNCGIL